jgi:hypothetical protein
MRDEDVVAQFRRKPSQSPLPQMWLHWRNKFVASDAARYLRWMTQRTAAILAYFSVLCPECSQPIDRDTIGAGERVFWCPHCAAVQSIPLFRIPGWVAGTMLILAIKLRFAL